MSVYVGKNVSIVEQIPLNQPISHKVIGRYDFGGVLAADSGSHEAYHHSSTSEPNPPFGAELADGSYQNIMYSDNARFSKTATVNGEYAVMLFRYKCGFAEADLKKLVASFEGYGTAPGGNGLTVKIWDHSTLSWDHAVTGTAGSDETLEVSLTSGLANHVDDNGYVWVLARTTNPSDGATAAVLYCDFAMCYAAKANFTVDCYPISDRDQNGVANEASHVMVKKNGAEVAVSSVNDSSGLVTLASGDFAVDDYVTIEYRYDRSPYVAQELSVEPKQAVEGVDGLGSDTIQVWAPVLKEIGGSIKETLQPGSLRQLSRLKPVGVREDQFCSDINWDPLSGTWTIENETYKGVAGGSMAYSLWKQSGFSDFKLEIKIKPATATSKGIFFRRQETGDRYQAYLYSNQIRLTTPARVIASTYFAYQQDAWYKMLVVARKVADSNEFHVYFDSGSGYKYLFSATNSLYLTGLIGLQLLSGTTYYDDARLQPLDAADPNGNGGLIVSWDQGGSVVKMGLDGVVFPEASIPSPKNAPVFITTPFRAQSAKTIS